MNVQIDSEIFFKRLERLQNDWLSHKNTIWGGVDAVCIPMGQGNTEDVTYSKSNALHLYLLGYEFPDTIMLLTRTTFYVMATSKKCAYIQAAAAARQDSPITIKFINKSKDEAANREGFLTLISEVKKSGTTAKLGTLIKGDFSGPFIPSWAGALEGAGLETVEIASALGKFLAVKDEAEIELCKRAAVLSNKVMKHGFVKDIMEDIIDKDLNVSHYQMAEKTENIISDPNKIGLKVSKDIVESCYFPIVQSGGKYDIRVSAQSNKDYLSYDIIICSLGARYKNYCANISRTYMVDAPPKVEQTYSVLLSAYEKCLEQMIPGNELKDVYTAAQAFLTKRDPALLPFLPKNLGFAIGIEFRDPSLLLSSNNTSKFVEGMLFNLSVGFSGVPLTTADKARAPATIQSLNDFSMLVADTIVIMKDGPPNVLTTSSKEFGSVSYNLSGKDGNDDAEEEGVDANENGEDNQDLLEGRRSTRNKDEKAMLESRAAERIRRLAELADKSIAEARKRMQGAEEEKQAEVLGEKAVDLKTYTSPAEYPRDVTSFHLRVDMEKEAVFVPIGGIPVPFHVSTIKSITMPDPDKATYLRINFYGPGATIPKDAPKNIHQLVAKYGQQFPFIKDLTFRSLDSRNMTSVFQRFVELRKKVRQREQKAEQERDLVAQAKLIRIKDERVPRLQDLTMRPTLARGKCNGTIEAHQNGLRFTSNKGEILDVLYSNIKHAIFGPCNMKSVMVLIHFHLKDPIMIGKKKHSDVQFYTEVVEASENLDSARRSSYDPDEIESEQRELEMRKRLNVAFREFCKKVEKIAERYSAKVEFDAPEHKLGFYGNCSKEMVFVQPCAKCLVSLTEVPFFLVSLELVEHVHFERVTYAQKAFDMVFIFKNMDVIPRVITAIEMKYLEQIQEWLLDVEIPYTQGTMNVNWAQMIPFAKDYLENGIFYEDVVRMYVWACILANP